MDYAKKANAAHWLRHPIIGDPSFDAFEKTGTIHRSSPPFEWAVNGSLFADFDGIWYLYAGLYPEGYRVDPDAPSHFIIYRSADKGKNWVCLGEGFEKGFRFDGHAVPSDHFPDAVIFYDEKQKKYLLTYDWCTNNYSWKTAHTGAKGMDSGSAIAWASNPAGPFTRVKNPYISNEALRGKLGRFSRLYAATVIPRKNDYLSLALCDSGEYFAWGLSCLTASDSEGEWSEPKLLLSPDRNEYYPPLLEFYPCFVVGDTVYAPATSVARNRNYQCVFAAELEKAHQPEAWRLVSDGNVWHSRPVPEERFGIWGQTISGFVEGGRFYVIYPSRDDRGYGVISTASRRWDEPISDGFTLSGHGGKSVSPLLRGYRDFTLEADFLLSGCAEIAFDYRGVLGPDRVSSDASPDNAALYNYNAVRIENNTLSLISVDENGLVHTQRELESDSDIKKVSIERNGERIAVSANGGAKLTSSLPPAPEASPVALIAHEFTVITCKSFDICGKKYGLRLVYSAKEAILGAGQREKDFEALPDGTYLGSAGTTVKWNVYCARFELDAPKIPGLGRAEVIIDGNKEGEIDYSSKNTENPGALYVSPRLPYGPHGIRLKPLSGKYAIGRLTAYIE